MLNVPTLNKNKKEEGSIKICKRFSVPLNRFQLDEAYRESGTRDPKVENYGGILSKEPRMGPLSMEKPLKTFTNSSNPEWTAES